MTKCDICKVEVEKPNSVVVKFWGGEEHRWLVCRRCGESIRSLLMGMMDKITKPGD